MYYLCIHVTRPYNTYTLSTRAHALRRHKARENVSFCRLKTAIKCPCTRRRHSSCCRYMTSDVHSYRAVFLFSRLRVGALSTTYLKVPSVAVFFEKKYIVLPRPSALATRSRVGQVSPISTTHSYPTVPLCFV